MIIDKNIESYLVLDEESVRATLAKIDRNREGMVFCVDTSGRLTGVLTDGDVRRWAIATPHVDLERPVRDVMNRDFTHAAVTDGIDRIRSLFSARVEAVPLVDLQERCVAVARRRKGVLQIGRHGVGEGHPVLVVAEIGNNHNGCVETALRMVDEAAAAGADCVKFQLRDLATLYRNAGDPDDARQDLGTQYTLDLLAENQLAVPDLLRVFDHCTARGVTPLCTPWDEASLEVLEGYGLAAYKVASADFVNHDFLKALARTGKPLICSTGMSTEREIRDSVDLLRDAGAQFVLLHCNSTYPAPFKDVNLLFMRKLKAIGDCPVGYSSHDRGIAVVVAAATLGASVIEKHFTLDRAQRGNDHRVSLLPGEFAEMVTAIRQVEMALGTTERTISQGEAINRETLGKSLTINRDLAAGQTITEAMIEIRSPGIGLAPYRKRDVVGKAARRDLAAGAVLFESDVVETTVASRPYHFQRPFGIPVRWHDVAELAPKTNLDLLEFHLSYKDLETDFGRWLERPLDLDLVVHAPELFAGDHVLDLCSLDEDYRRHSIAELARVVALTRRLRPLFRRAERPRVVVNVGGFTQDRPLPESERAARYRMVLDSLAGMDLDGVEILPQTMPPFPWHFGGQRYQNLFLDPDETAAFCTRHGFRVCLDTSHSKLACTHLKWSFDEFLAKVGPHSGHLHVADARGVDGEGLQIGEGEIALAAMGRALARFAPGVSFIPEIWQGHKNGGEGFWIALERLEKHL